ncbi:MAG: JAB domain-containing protein [Opitutaceae bacterium]|jgi:DNA repair protein RadC|nr:JAB domain-containing protein [Opitutaceae bacterium]NBR59846.1 JAB domain-containing protein [Opitutaceae bacterium]
MSKESYPPLRLKDLAVQDRPQERLEKLGPSVLSDTELLAMLLRSGTKGHNVLIIAQRLMTEAGSLAQLVQWSDADFRRQIGIGRVKAWQLVTVMEIARRVLSQEAALTPIFNRADLVLAHFRSQIIGLNVEKFWVLCLNRKNRLIKQVEVTSGTATSSLAHPREVFREAIRQGATAVLCVHNHPSGDPAPSAADIQVTRQLREAAQAIDISLLDHVIVGQATTDPLGRGYYSFREVGLL